MMIPFIDLQAQQNRISDKIDAALQKVLGHGQFIMGPEVAELETKLAQYTGAKHVISCANGTDALVLALRAMNIGPKDAVFAPSFTFVATVEAIKIVGATPVFVDVDMETFNMCPTSLSEAIELIKSQGNLAPKAIIAVDLFGQPADYTLISKVAQAESLKIIDDAAQSFGATLNGQKTGTLADFTTTSFFPAKPLGCYGDGGALFVENNEIAALLRSIRNHGKGKDRYDNVRIGLNSRLDTIQAAILLEKLEIFEDEMILRDKVATFYNNNVPDSMRPQKVLKTATSAWAQYTLVHHQRDTVQAILKENGIPTAVYYPKPNHLQAPYRDDPVAPNGLKNTELLQQRVFSLPMHPYLEEPVQAQICDILAKI